MNNPAQMSRSNDSEICATTNPLASRAFLSVPDALPVSSFSAEAGATPDDLDTLQSIIALHWVDDCF